MISERNPSPLAVTAFFTASLVFTAFALLLEQKSRTGVTFNDGISRPVALLMLTALMAAAVMLSIEERRA